MPIIEGAIGRPLEVAGVPGAGTNEVQTLTPSGSPTGGTFQLSFDGINTADIDFDCTAAELLAALEAIDSIGSGGLGVTGVKAQGTLTIAEPVTDGDTFTIAGVTYTLLSSFVDAENNVFIGANEAATKVNIVAAINATGGTPGTTHYTSQTAHPLVTVAAFAGDDMVITARQVGTFGNSLGTTETLTHVSNVFDAATLGTTTAGTNFAVTFDGNNLQKKAQPLIVLAENAFTGGTTPGLAVAETTPGVDATARGAGKGKLAIDTTNAILYINTGTAVAPTWTKVGTQS